MEVNKILSADLLDIIFEGRNKEYGAYYLRKTYNERVKRALIITASIAGAILLISFLNQTLGDRGDSKVKINEMTLQDVKQEEKRTPAASSTTASQTRTTQGGNEAIHSSRN